MTGYGRKKEFLILQAEVSDVSLPKTDSKHEIS